MSTQLNLQINALAFADNNPSNNPMIRHFDLTYKLFGMPVKNPDLKPYSIAPGSSQTIYDGTRNILLDGTTQLDVIKPYPDKNIYRFVWNGSGTNPIFRTERSIGITTATSFSITVSGPVVTFTVTSGPFNTSSVQVGDVFLIEDGSGVSAVNRGRFVIISKTATSVSIQNLNGASETFTILDPTKFLIFNNGGSSNQPQIGDYVTISSGFSPATYGTYEIVEVAPTWIEVNVGLPAGIPLETGVLPGSSGFIIYKAVKKFVLVAAQQKVSILFNEDTSNAVVVEPIEADNPERPGILMKQGPFYKLTINNTGLSQANLIVATAE